MEPARNDELLGTNSLPGKVSADFANESSTLDEERGNANSIAGSAVSTEVEQMVAGDVGNGHRTNFVAKAATPETTIADACGGAFPFGKSVVPHISSADSMPIAGQYATAALTVVCLGALPFVPALLMAAGIDGSWDQQHNVTWSLSDLMHETMGARVAQGNTAEAATAAFFGVLFLLDTLSEFFPQHIRWPQSWNTNNRQCYTEMFCEPERRTLVRHPGNTYSNFIFFYLSIAILESVADLGSKNKFVVPDAIFGGMLNLLAVLSTIWHASNAPKSQYLDLWAMDSCIAYLILRVACQGEIVMLNSAFSLSVDVSTTASWMTCTVAYILIIAANGAQKFKDQKEGFLDAGCPFAARTLLLTGCDIITGAQIEDAAGGTKALYGFRGVSITILCIVAGAPVLFMILPVLMMAFAMKTAGSVVAYTFMVSSLVIG